VVTIELPRAAASPAAESEPSAPSDTVTSNAWTGAYGSRNQDVTMNRPDDRTLRFTTTRPLGIGEGVTVDVGLPEGMLARPTWLSEVGAFLADNFAYGLIPLSALGCLAFWWLRGRDEPGRGTIVVEYSAPDNLAPAEIGTLIDESVDLRDLSSTFIDLAVRGYLTIEEVPTPGLGKSGTDYRFRKLKDAGGLKPYERTLFDHLFGKKTGVLLSDLKDKFYSVLPLAKGELYKSLTGQKYFAGNPSRVRAGFAGAGVVLVGALVLLCVLVQHAQLGRVFVLPLVIAGLCSLLIVGISSVFMPRKTRKGRIAWEQIRGLEEYIRRAEISDIQAQDRRGVFERLLPIAIALNLADRWGKAFEGLYTQPPDWYRTSGDAPFSTGYLVGSINQSVGSMNTILPAQPRTEGGSGGSSWSSGGFSGGGSSGGGFGGGSTGSW
jgi:uncharacterized membrane protein YgcG